MSKRICGKCGNETDGYEYRFPRMWDPNEDTWGRTVGVFPCILCDDCAEKVAACIRDRFSPTAKEDKTEKTLEGTKETVQEQITQIPFTLREEDFSFLSYDEGTGDFWFKVSDKSAKALLDYYGDSEEGLISIPKVYYNEISTYPGVYKKFRFESYMDHVGSQALRNILMKLSAEAKKIVTENKRLIQKYPFLYPRDKETGERIEDYNYSYTIMDDMPEGWRKAFGEKMLDALLLTLEEAGCTDSYWIQEIREEYGRLQWEAQCEPGATRQVIRQYQELSEDTCIKCGAPATTWRVPYNPLCEYCLKKYYPSYVYSESEE